MSWDDDYWVKEEPDCYACCDSGERCRYCRPTRLQALWHRLTWRAWWWIRQPGRRFDSEAPF